MEDRFVRITAATKDEVDEAYDVTSASVSAFGAITSPVPLPKGKRKRFIEAGAVLDVLLQIPVGVAAGLIANEIFLRLRATSREPEKVNLTTQANQIVVSNETTGLRIVIRDSEVLERHE